MQAKVFSQEFVLRRPACMEGKGTDWLSCGWLLRVIALIIWLVRGPFTSLLQLLVVFFFG